MCVADLLLARGRLGMFGESPWQLLFWAATLAAALSAASAGFLDPRAGTAAKWGKAIFGLHIGTFLFWFAWGVPSGIISAIR